MDATPLERRALQNFDDLLEREQLFWKDTQPQVVKSSPFDFEFRVAPSFKSKPVLPADAKGRSEDTGAFGDDDPAFTIESGISHKLILNKFCVVRPQFVLHTTEFEQQSDPLTHRDIEALWQTMQSLGQGKYIGIFNCGAKAGSSIGHKHMQVFPRSDHTIFPDSLVSQHRIDGTAIIPLRHPEVSYEHAVLPNAQTASADAIFRSYENLRHTLQLEQDSPHNAIITGTSITVIPRTQANVGPRAVNAAGMLGMVWVKTGDELEAWKEYGPAKVLKEVGVQHSLP
ncbi:hypothetical protein DOTSEDRAFT_36842 [Dothistroma septosporum NZE10]|uniref:Uncharacterized protein n=1 Tax=Dothistroma septosporum (strain NZE10 / CBS 128990) TaxID=675120 RepID=N1PGD5_DOTSN|nr:hypothetical protein DOTSEDRAFT_36842 [Dothistroma septosporum NZE10]